MYTFNLNDLSIVAISDTHGCHGKLTIPSCDILIHAGDVCNYGNREEISEFMEWFVSGPARYKIFVAGNHDTTFEQEIDSLIALIPEEVIYLDNSVITIQGVCFASTPARPYLGDFVDLEGVDVFITHGAPYGVLDKRLGCKHLAIQISEAQPKYALFGHIHLSESQHTTLDGITYVNLTSQ